ncbi:hypothetical protein Salat_2658700 [Sesamum alatum]|uniref:Uncharacterized protein n=1 Tax=Sesamum alatum TaxID=300844 RepID=A0AAE1XQ87_9LAMI|nr:hypothetical protein Salat_2658700 [Sesamum alatum]
MAGNRNFCTFRICQSSSHRIITTWTPRHLSFSSTPYSFELSLQDHFPIYWIGSNLISFSGFFQLRREDKMASQDSNSLTAVTSPKGEGVVSPRGQCLCSPTTHQGSFRCRFHRSTAKPEWFKRSKSMPAADTARGSDSVSPKSVEFK